MDRVLGGMEKRSGAVGDLALNPFSLEHHDRFRRLGVPVGGDHRARSKAAEKKTGPGGGIMRKGREFDPGIRSGLPKGGVG